MPFPRSVRVLIVEDVSVVALSLADVLTEDGFRVVGPVGTQREALAVLEKARPDAVILDLALQDGFCTGLAKELRARGVPFVVFSGYPRESISAAEFRDVPWIEKPGNLATIVAAIGTVVMQARNGLAPPEAA